MSLVVWLPLTKDLRQQGLLSVTVTNNGATFNSAGKLGGCYGFDGSDYITIVSNDLKTLFSSSSNSHSMACWIYLNSDETDRVIIFGNYSSNPFMNWELTASEIQRVCAGGTSNYTTHNSTTAIAKETWVHIAYTYNGSQTKFYINGVLTNTVSGSNTLTTMTSNTFWLGSDNRTGATRLKGKLNDFRIYDHCLSPMEVKELAKGLVLHYPLNRQGWGQENILTNSSGYQGTSYWNARVTVGNENGIPYLIAKRTDTTTSSRLFYQHDSLTNYVSSWAPGDSFTISGYYKIPSTEEYEIVANLFIRWTRVSGENSYDDTGFSTSLTDEKDKWIRFEKTYVVPANYQNGAVSFNLTAFSKGLSTVYWRYVKIEKGDKATPWCPNSSDVLAATMGLNSTIEYDCSGFGNNGTRTGTFSWMSDTPKYTVSTEFNTNNYIIIDPLTIDMNNVSFATWVKWDAFNSYSRVWDFGQVTSGGGYCCFLMNDATNGSIKLRLRNASGTELLNYNFITANTNTWYHIAFTLSNTTCKVYVNGALKGTKTLSSNIGTATFNYPYIGKSNWSTDALLDGKLSDFRIYATALSADDVKSLYQNSAYIDSSGNVYGAVHEEV